MVSVKNPKDIAIKGDYNLVYHNDQLVAIILVAVEHTRRERHQGGNRFLVYEYEAAKGYQITEEWQEKPEEGDIKLAQYCGCWQCLRLHKAVDTRNTEDTILVRVPASLIKVEQYSSVLRPLNIKWSYSWHEYDTKERVLRKVYLSDIEEGCSPVWEVLRGEDAEEALWRQAPTLQQMCPTGQEYISCKLSYNGNILVHLESRGIYAWYKPDGTPLTYSDEGEWSYLYSRCSGYHGDAQGALQWATKEYRSRRGLSDYDSESTDDTDGDDLTPRRIRRGRSGARRERLAQQEAAEAEAAEEE